MIERKGLRSHEIHHLCLHEEGGLPKIFISEGRNEFLGKREGKSEKKGKEGVGKTALTE